MGGVPGQEDSTLTVVGRQAVVDVEVREPTGVREDEPRQAPRVDQGLQERERRRLATIALRRNVRRNEAPPAGHGGEDEEVALVVEERVALIVFEVAVDANKPLIKEAVEALFGVKVKAVNTTITKGKTKRFRGKLGTRKATKKAYVTLEEGNTIDVTTGL